MWSPLRVRLSLWQRSVACGRTTNNLRELGNNWPSGGIWVWRKISICWFQEQGKRGKEAIWDYWPCAPCVARAVLHFRAVSEGSASFRKLFSLQGSVNLWGSGGSKAEIRSNLAVQTWFLTCHELCHGNNHICLVVSIARNCTRPGLQRFNYQNDLKKNPKKTQTLAGWGSSRNFRHPKLSMSQRAIQKSVLVGPF